MNPDVQKVLDFIREGAKAASGPAKWGFEQVCAYRASAALGSIISDLAAAVIFAALVIPLVPSIKKGRKTSYDDFWAEVGAPAVAVILILLSAGCLLHLCACLPDTIATIRNPAGAVLNSLTNR